MLNLFQHRQIEVNKPKSRRRKRDFRALATLKQVQGDKIVPSFRIYFGIARLKSVITALATLNQVQGDEKL